MTVYQHRATLAVSAGAGSSTSLNVLGGVLRHVLMRANTSQTLFRANLTDENNLVVLNYDFHAGEINDTAIAIPIAGKYTVNITNASPNDTFSVYLSIEE